jgi:hypothetical protein
VTTPPDDLGDPRLERLLGAWFQSVRRRAARPFTAPGAPESPDAFAVFPPPADLSRLRQQVQRLEEELTAIREPTSVLERVRARVQVALDEAASRAESFIRGLRLAPALAGPLRDGGEAKLRSGDRVLLHMEISKPCWAFVALLDDRLVLAPVSSTPRWLEASAHQLGPYRLDDQAGIETFVVLTSTARGETKDFEGHLAAAAAAGAGRSTHEEALAAILLAIEARTGERPGHFTYQHLPR